MIIDIGPGATNRNTYSNAGITYIDLANPANLTGIIDTLQIWANSNLPVGTKIGTFYLSGGQYACRAYYTTTSIITSGAVRTLTGLSIAVQAGDYLGIYFATGRIERASTGGSGVLWKGGDQFGAGLQTYATFASYAISIYGTGNTVGEAPTVTIETIKTGTATATTTNHLIDTTLNQFVAGDVGRTLKNTTDNTYAVVTAYNSPSDLTITPSIMASGETYRLDVLYLDQDSFTVEGAITDVGLDSCHTRGFCYMQGAGTPTIADQKVYDNGAGAYGVGTYYKPITGLNPGTLYSVRAFATNAIGTGYSSVIQVTTRIIVAPTAITQPASNVESTIATINGKISEDGGASCEARFRWRVYTPFPYTFPFTFAPEGTETAWQNSLIKDSLFHEHLTGLTPDTIYSFLTQARSWTTPEDQILMDTHYTVSVATRTRFGQRLTILDRMITGLSFWLFKNASPTGDITFTIRSVATDEILNSKVWGDASTLPVGVSYLDAVKETVTFDTPILINEEVRILVEFSGVSFINVVAQSTDVKADELKTYYDVGYTDSSGVDCAYEYEYHLTGEWSIAEQFTTLVAFAYVYLTGSLNFAGTLAKTTTKYLTGELPLAGLLTKTISKYLTGGLTFIGTLAASTAGYFYVYLTGSLSFAGSLTKTTTKYLRGVLTPTGKLVKTTTKFIQGAISFLGGLLRPGEPHTMGLFTIPYRDMRAFSRPYRDMAVESRPYRDMVTENREVKL